MDLKGKRQSLNVVISRVVGDPANGILTPQQYDNPQTVQTPALPPSMPSMGVSQNANSDPQAVARAQQFAGALGNTPDMANAFTASQRDAASKMIMMAQLRHTLERQKIDMTKPLQRKGRSRWSDENKQPNS